MNNSLKLAAVLIAVTASTASAQGKGRNTNGVPPGMRPPAGYCRVWINGVPPGQQPGVTDCASAQLQVPANGRVIYGSGTSRYRTSSTLRTHTRKRQLADGSWVLDRYRRDTNGNVSILSTTPLTTNANGTWNHKRSDDNNGADVSKAQHKADKQAWKNEKKAQKNELKAEKKELKENSKRDKNEDQDNS